MAGRTALHNTAFTLAGQLLARAFALALYSVLARVLGPELYGDLGVGTSFGVLFAVLVEPGLNPLLVRDVAREPARAEERVAEALGYKLAALLLAWPLMVATGWALGYRGSTLWGIALSGATLLLVCLEDFASAALMARERMDLEGAYRTAGKLLFAGAGLGAALLGASFPVLLGAMAAAQALSGALGLAVLSRSGVRVRASARLGPALARVREAWPLAATSLLWMVTLRLDQVLASLLGVPRADLGDYNAAVKLVEALILFPTAVATSFGPILARSWGSAEARQHSLRLALEAALTVSLPVAVGGAALSGPLATLVYGGRFEGAGRLLAYQLLALPFIAVQFTCFAALVAAGALRGQTLAVALNLATNVAANLLLVPHLGILGSTLAAVAGGVTSSITCAWALKAEGVPPPLASAAWRPLLASLAMGAAVAWLSGRAPWPLALAAGLLLFPALAAALGGARLLAELKASRTPAHLET